MLDVSFTEKEKVYLDDYLQNPDTAIVYYGAVLFVVEKLKEMNGWEFRKTESTEFFKVDFSIYETSIFD